jgi:hypothetical protein
VLQVGWQWLRGFWWAIAPAFPALGVFLAGSLLLLVPDQIRDAFLAGLLAQRFEFVILRSLVLFVTWGFVSFWWSRHLLTMARDKPAWLPAIWMPGAPENAFIVTWLPRVLGAVIPLIGTVNVIRVGFFAWPELDGYQARVYGWATGFALVAFLLFVFLSLRRKLWNGLFHRMQRMPDRPNVSDRLPSPRDVFWNARFLWLTTGLLTIFVIVVALYFPIPLSRALLGPIGIAPFALAGMVTGFSLIALIAEWSRLPILRALLLWALIWSHYTNNHAVRLSDTQDGPTTRPDIDQAILDFAKIHRDAAGRPHFLVVATAGGGIRAAYWTGIVLGQLHDDPERLDRDMFAISSVSGGSIGAVFYRALRSVAYACSFRQSAAMLATADDLSPTLLRFLSTDTLQKFLPFIHVPDRAAALEASFEADWRIGAPRQECPIKSEDGNLLAAPFHRFWANQAETALPALFINATSVHRGRRMIASTLAFNQEEESVDFPDAVDLVAAPLNFTVSSAAGISARFPFLGPAGIVENRKGQRDELVDGGYFENFGAVTALDIVDRIAAKTPDACITLLQISNDPLLPATPLYMDWPGWSNFGPELRPILLGVAHAREARGFYGTLVARRRMNALTCGGYANARLDTHDGPALAPLGWVLSTGAARWMDRQLDKKWSGLKEMLEANSYPRKN